MADFTLTARQLAPRLSSAAFDAAFSELSAARVAYEGAPRNPQNITQLADASVRLADARCHMQATLHDQAIAGRSSLIN